MGKKLLAPFCGLAALTGCITPEFGYLPVVSTLDQVSVIPGPVVPQVQDSPPLPGTGFVWVPSGWTQQWKYWLYTPGHWTPI